MTRPLPDPVCRARRRFQALARTTLAALALALALALAMAAPARAGNVDLSTIPDRDSVQLTIYNSADLTLVRETRRVTFARGNNPLQFSWAGTLIDPTSVNLEFRTHAEDLDVADATFPHDKPQMLFWNVASTLDGEAVVEISYFTSGITWEADYTATVEPGGTHLALDGFVRIVNGSGEDYADAQVRLVVGEINLVEQIADLARRGLATRADLEAAKSGAQFRELDEKTRVTLGFAMRQQMDAAEGRPKEIIKEGLSEYFIYTIEGTETVPHAWSKRLRLLRGARVPFRVAYRYRPAEYGDQLVRLFILRNDEASSLGSTPLPDGTVRLFLTREGEPGRDGLSYLGAHPTKYVPIGQEIELDLGPDPEVVHERLRLRSWRDAFWFQSVNGRTYFSPDRGDEVRHDYPVAGWDDHERWVERVRNYRDEPIDVEIRLAFDGDVTFDSPHAPRLHDYRSPQITARVDAGASVDLGWEITVRQGISRKQSRVQLAE